LTPEEIALRREKAKQKLAEKLSGISSGDSSACAEMES